MLQLIASDISTHHHQLQQLGVVTIKLQLQLEKIVKTEDAVRPRPVNEGGKVRTKSLSEEQKSVFLFR